MFSCLFLRYLSFGLPGLGMFAESYIIFSVGNIKQWQQWSFPSCYVKLWPVQECGANNYLGFLDYGADSYVQLIGIIVSVYLSPMMLSTLHIISSHHLLLSSCLFRWA